MDLQSFGPLFGGVVDDFNAALSEEYWSIDQAGNKRQVGLGTIPCGYD